MHAPARTHKRWAIRWESGPNSIDGERAYFVGGPSLLFKTKRECCEYIQDHWGYIRKRPDLHRFPHGWRMPKAVRVTVVVIEGDVELDNPFPPAIVKAKR